MRRKTQVVGITLAVIIGLLIVSCDQSPGVNGKAPVKADIGFAIDDPSVVYIDSQLGDCAPLCGPYRIGQPPDAFSANARVVYLMDNNGTPFMYSLVPTKTTKSSGSLKDLTFQHGAIHFLVGKVSFGGTAVFDSSSSDPLQFKCDMRKGYIYVGGTGTVTLQGKRRISFSGGR